MCLFHGLLTRGLLNTTRILVKATRYDVRDCAACLFWHQREPNWHKIVWQNAASHISIFIIAPLKR